MVTLLTSAPGPVRAGEGTGYPVFIDQQDPIFIPPGQLKKLRRKLMPGFEPGGAGVGIASPDAPPLPPPDYQAEPIEPQVIEPQAMEPQGLPRSMRLIPESMAVAQAMSVVPDGKPLGVRLLPGPRAVYAVRLRTASQVIRIIVDAETGAILGQ